MAVNEAILVIAFNRPDHLAQVIDRLREVEPEKLYVAIDGPRADRVDEADRVEACRELVATVDWSCQVRTLFHEENLGCGRGVSSAITWFFEHEPRGIILEDDIVPDPSFFPFCEDLLDRYEDDKRVFAISGCNFVPPEGLTDPTAPYRFSQVPHIWGWATWRRSWAHHDLDISDWRERLSPWQLWGTVGKSVPGTVYWTGTFELLGRQEVDTWDGQLVLAAMESGQLTATSNINLIRNVGFDAEATHTLVDMGDLQPQGSMTFPVREVPVERDTRADAWTLRHHFRATWKGMMGQGLRHLNRRKAASR